MPPLRGVEDRAFERLDAWDRRKSWLAERPVAENEEIRCELALRSGDVPLLLALMPGGIEQSAIPLNMGKDAKTFCAVAQIFFDFALRRKGMAPAGIERE